MKKLSLKNLKLGASDMLQRNQLRTVFGGYGGYGGEETCFYYTGCSTHCVQKTVDPIYFTVKYVCNNCCLT